ncbi:MAG TPA: NUMOD4 domain-containing protein [Chitinophagaceae bacterium]
MKTKTLYPYLDKSERNRPGEIWKNVTGFEGYKVSNQGRVRSVDRNVFHSRYGLQFVKGRILSQNPKKNYNQYTNDYAVILQTTLMQKNVRYDVIVRRLVYAAFKDPGILYDRMRMVISRDGDGYNTQLYNLKAVDNSERMRLVSKRNRMPNTLSILDHRKFKPTFSLWKPVHRCDQKGRVLKTYLSIVYAVKEGYNEKGIINAAKRRTKMYKGFKWKYASRRVLKKVKDLWNEKY